jgi:hypothetical protein
MQVTVDTRQDSLSTVLSVLANAYGVPLSLISADVDVANNLGRATAKVSRNGGSPDGQRRDNPAATTTTRKPSGSKRIPVRRHANVAPRGQARKIREWAREQGYVIGDAGRLPADVIAAYRVAQKA